MKRHIGKLKNGGNSVIVVFMSLPNDKDHCLVVDIDAIPDLLRDDLNDIIKSDEAQNLRTIHDLLYRRMHRNGGSIIEQLHNGRHLMRLPVEDVLMTPRNDLVVPLPDILRDIRKMEDGTEDIPDEEIEIERNIKKEQVMQMQEDEKTTIGKNILAEAEELEAQSQLLIAEAKKKRDQAKEYLPVEKPKTTEETKTKEPEPDNENVVTPVKRKPGRPKKST